MQTSAAVLSFLILGSLLVSLRFRKMKPRLSACRVEVRRAKK
jgi:hypothetical protein